MNRPIRVSIHALGGQGGGVLADWITDLAEHAGWIVQATSVPGVAQRTGATVYYIELARPDPEGRQPVLALMPIPGDVDLVIASELMEAGRAIARALVTPARTTLIASSQRIMAIAEKSAPGDGAMPSARVVAAAESASKRLVLADFSALAERQGAVISAALFGAVAGAEALPFPREAFEAAVRRGGVGVETSLAVFAAAYGLAQGRTPPDGPSTEYQAAERTPSTNAGLEARVRALPAPARTFARLGVERCVDYQDRAYAGRYLDRLDAIAKADAELGGARFDWRLTREAARHLALWMTYEDVIRVADLKTRPGRLSRVEAEVRLADDQLLEVTEFMHPRFEEFCDTLPDALGARLKDSGAARRLLAGLFREGRQVSTSRLGGFLLLFAIARLRRLRPISHRHHLENQRIEAWLASAANAARANYDLGCEVIGLQRLVKGYGETHERGLRRYGAILATLQGLAERPGAEAAARAMSAAALKDDTGALLAREIEAAGGPPMVALA